jgi:hypothetical protein
LMASLRAFLECSEPSIPTRIFIFSFILMHPVFDMK